MSDLVGNPDCWFSHAKANILSLDQIYHISSNFTHTVRSVLYFLKIVLPSTHTFTRKTPSKCMFQFCRQLHIAVTLFLS